MRSQAHITLIMVFSSFSLMSYQGQPNQLPEPSPFARLMQKILTAGLTGIIAGGTLEFVKQDALFQIKTPDGQPVMPWIGVIAALSYFVKLCYEESAEGLLPKLCSFLIGLKGGSLGAQKALVHDWSKWSR